jgi:hypothetical protein
MEKYIERAVIGSDARLICKRIAEVEASWRRQGLGSITTTGQQRHRCNKSLSRSLLGALLAVMLLWLIQGPVSAGESLYPLGYDVIGQTEQVLKRAGLNSPQWHTRPEAIQRDIYDITFLLEQAVRASEKLNEPAKQDYAQQALTLLQRAVRRGHFDSTSIEPVLKVIHDLLPNMTV